MDVLTGYAVFHWVATWANPACDVLFRAATDLGYHTFYYLSIAPLFWIVDRRRASVLFLLILASGLLNTVAKIWIHTPRPDPTLARVLDFRPYQSGSASFPSGHAQNAVVFWGYLAWWVGRRWFTATTVLLILLISFSRLYLAVHFPIDILGGWILGVALLLALPARLERWSQTDFRVAASTFGVAVIASLALTFLSADATIAAICGSLMGFLIAAAWLPQAPLIFTGARQVCVGVVCGLALLFALSMLLDVLPHYALSLYAQVATMWIVALWVYPHLLQRIWLGRRAPDLQAG